MLTSLGAAPPPLLGQPQPSAKHSRAGTVSWHGFTGRTARTGPLPHTSTSSLREARAGVDDTKCTPVSDTRTHGWAPVFSRGKGHPHTG